MVLRPFRCAPGCGYCCKISPITIFPHEVHILRRLARSLDRDVTIRPGYKIVDLLSRVRVVISYILDLDARSGVCPFLENDRCLIHGRYKPVTCRAFPRVPKVLQYVVDRESRGIYFSYEIGISKACPEVKRTYTDQEIDLLISSPEIARKVMPAEFQACEEFLHIRKLYLDILTMIWRRGLAAFSDEISYPWPLVNAYDFIRQYYPEITIHTFTGGREIRL
ncbi:MAG: YkgJ family cysteine cluster protein [Crenarchaeota archaeon]|nr:YkgJ family cysteine cluster protein [Thermoproteota archaeon]